MYHYQTLANWAKNTELSTIHLDCITTVMLKILDGKCKMSDNEKLMLMDIYNVTKTRPGKLFGEETHDLINTALVFGLRNIKGRIHKARVEAEAKISKPVMKSFKAMMRDTLAALMQQARASAS